MSETEPVPGFVNARTSDLEWFLNLHWPESRTDAPFRAKLTKEFSYVFFDEGCTARTLIDARSRPIGFVATCLISPTFLDLLCASEQPDIVTKLAKHRSALTDFNQIGKLNAGQNLVGVVISYSLDQSLKGGALAKALNGMMEEAIRSFKGYHLSNIVIECHHDSIEEELSRINFSVINSYEKFWRDNQTTRKHRPKLMSISRETAHQQRDFHMLRLFVSEVPRLMFSRAEIELLNVAMTFATDNEIAEILHISSETVKSRWKSIYSKAAAILPSKDMADSAQRQKEKRRKLLAYLASHPEELRPFIKKARAGARAN